MNSLDLLINSASNRMLGRAKRVYDMCGQMAGAVPYIFGGNHGNTNFRTEWRRGVDCSSGVSVALAAGFILSSPRALIANVTQGFESWGASGRGNWVSLYVLDFGTIVANGLFGTDFAAHAISLGETHHCALGFGNNSYFTHEWWQAANPRDGVGWIDFDPTGYNVRHWPGT